VLFYFKNVTVCPIKGRNGAIYSNVRPENKLRVILGSLAIAAGVLVNCGIYKNFVSVDLYHSEND